MATTEVCNRCDTLQGLRDSHTKLAAEFLGCEASPEMVDLTLARVEILREELGAAPGEDLLDAWNRLIKSGKLVWIEEESQL